MGSSKTNLISPTESGQGSSEAVQLESDVEQTEFKLAQYAQEQWAQMQPSKSVAQQFTLKRMLIFGPLVAIFLSLPAATWSPAAEIHLVLLVATGYTFFIALLMLPISVLISTLTWAFSKNRRFAFRIGVRTNCAMLMLALGSLTYLLYSYCISMNS